MAGHVWDDVPVRSWQLHRQLSHVPRLGNDICDDGGHAGSSLRSVRMRFRYSRGEKYFGLKNVAQMTLELKS